MQKCDLKNFRLKTAPISEGQGHQGSYQSSAQWDPLGYIHTKYEQPLNDGVGASATCDTSIQVQPKPQPQLARSTSSHETKNIQVPLNVGPKSTVQAL